jgi:outer membrane protein TolC
VLRSVAALLCCSTLVSGAENPFPTSRYHRFDSQLEELTVRLLHDNPQLASAEEVWQSKLARADQVRALPDPTISYRYFLSTPETRVGPQVQGLQLNQAIPWSGRRGLAAQREQRLAAGATWELQDLERSLVARLKQAYFEAAYLQEALAVNAEETGLLERFEKIALRRYSTGQGNQQAVIKVQTEISRLVDQRSAQRMQLDTTLRSIAELIGSPGEALTLEPISLQLRELELELDPAALEQESMRGHPEVQAALERIEADQLQLRQSALASRPDLMLGLGWIDVRDRRDQAGKLRPPEGNGKDIWSLSVGLNLPVHGRKNRARTREAQSLMSAGHLGLRATRDRLRTEIRQALLRLESFGQRARLYAEVVVPQAAESLASAEAAYSTDRLDFLDLLDAQRVLLQVRLTARRLLADYWIAAADLERSLGRSFPGPGGQP